MAERNNVSALVNFTILAEGGGSGVVGTSHEPRVLYGAVTYGASTESKRGVRGIGPCRR